MGVIGIKYNKLIDMKKTILTTLVIFAALFSQAQVTVIDTTFQGDSKFQVAQTMLNRTVEYMRDEMGKEKINSDTILYEQEVVRFWNNLNQSLNIFAQNYMKFDTLVYEKIGDDLYLNGDTTQKGIVQEYNESTARLEELSENEYVQRLEKEIKELQEKQAKIAKIYQQLPDVAEWVQPAGAHDAYAKGAVVEWNGKIWENTIDANVWEPGVTGWKEVTK